MTKQRELIFDIIRNSVKHMNAEEIYSEAKKKMPSIVLATVYNNLNYLCENNLIRRVKVYAKPDRFDKTLYPHEHIICDKCGTISDMDCGDLTKELSKRSGFEITGYELNAHHICSKCKMQI